jgi:hypothetical protein
MAWLRVPSGVPLNAAPYKVTINSQKFGACCAVENKVIAGAGKSLAAGTYWIVWWTARTANKVMAEAWA